VVVNNLFGSATSTVAMLTILTTNGPPVITLQPTHRGGTTGGETTFTVAAAGAVPLFYQWLFNSNVINVVSNSTAASPTMILTNLTTNNNGAYQAVVTNNFGAVTSAVALLSVLPPFPGTSFEASDLSARPVIRSIRVDTTGVMVHVADGIAGGELVLEYKDALTDLHWKPVATNQASELKLLDPSPADRTRFYRVRTE
jgi:hypothetical protein